MENVVTIVSSMGASGLLAAVVVFLSRAWLSERLKSSIAHEYSQKLETHKAEVKLAYDLELERLRSALARAANEHQIRFASLYEEQASAIRELYAKLTYAEQTLQRAVDPMLDRQSWDSTIQHAATQGNSFRSFFTTNRILFTDDVANLVDSLWLSLKEAYYGAVDGATPDLDAPPASRASMPQSGRSDARKILKIQFPQLKSRLEQEFRRLLGVDEFS